MKCRTFNNQLLDWKSGRLSSEQAQHMAEHAQTCPFCAEEAGAEANLRDLWRAATPAPTRDLWPQIATRLEGQTAQSRRPAFAIRPPQWALVSAFGLAIAAVCGLSLGPKEFPSPTSHPPITVKAPSSSPSVGQPAWSEFSDVSRVNPVVDDPAGPSMQNVWVQINNSGDKAEDQ